MSTVVSMNVIPLQLAEDLVLVTQKGECSVDDSATSICCGDSSSVCCSIYNDSCFVQKRELAIQNTFRTC